MSFDLGQLFQGPVRDLVLGQVTKQFGLSNDGAGNLVNKGLSMVLGSMAQKAGSKEGATGLFDLIKNTAFSGNVNPLDIITGKSQATATEAGSLLELGKNLIPSIFGSRTDAVSAYLANSANTTSDKAKGVLGLLIPTIFAFFKNKIASGLGLGGFASLLGEQSKFAANHLDTEALGALGFANTSLNDVFGGVNRLASSLGTTTAAVGATAAGVSAATAAAAKSATTTATTSAANAAKPVVQSGKSGGGLWKWLVAAAVLLAALLGIKSCSSDKEVSAPVENKPAETAPAPKAEEKPAEAAPAPKAEEKPAEAAPAPKAEEKPAETAPAPKAEEKPAETAPAAAATPAPEVKVTEGLGDLGWMKSDKDLTVSGTVQNEGIKSSILDAFKGLAAGLPIVDNLKVDPSVGKFSFDNFGGLADIFKNFPGINGSFADKVFNLTGEVASDEDKTSLIDKVKALLGGLFSINADGVKVNAPATAAAPAATPAEEPEAEVIADMSAPMLDLNIVFDTAKSDIKARYNRRLDAFAKYLIDNKRGGEISGHTDNVGDAAANQKLSEERANAVRNYLVGKGVPADSLTAVGYGQDKPAYDNNTEEGRSKNRRIEFNAK
ncbi:OmpA family protein [Pelistega sp. MC2]|uniref:OmpA family protein n=1 Tax=Pelistega sp. MC2 TaxID=1720297 RepID=UPI0008D9E213|nr:OmpA family protein [Pelistega sp. MC2]